MLQEEGATWMCYWLCMKTAVSLLYAQRWNDLAIAMAEEWLVNMTEVVKLV